MKSIFFILIISSSKIVSQQVFYVSPNGSDSNSGSSSSSPFKTINRAKEVVSTISNNATSDIIINIMPGTHKISETLNFTSSDSGKNGHYIIYKAYNANDKPILDGGFAVPQNSWILHDSANKIWKANINDNYSRQVYSGSEKLIRARSENADDLLETKNGYFSSCTNFSNWLNIKDIEVISEIEWKMHIIPVKEVCNKQLIIHQKFWDKSIHYKNDTTGVYERNQFRRAPPIRIENAYELIDKENEWYIDRSINNQHQLFIKNNSSLPPQNIIVPRLTYFVLSENTQNVKFDGLFFKYSNWTRPSHYDLERQSNLGLAGGQADILREYKNDNGDYTSQYQIPGSLSFKKASKISIVNCDFENIGSTGIEILDGSRDNIICNNKFHQVSGSAISVGAWIHSNNDIVNESPVNHALVISNTTISNNLIDSIGTDYLGSVGIFVSFARNSTIKNNEIKNFPYSGISVGWGWSSSKYMGVNDISNNYIDCTNQQIIDGGAIYILSNQGISGSQNRSTIQDNYILNNIEPHGAIYLDAGSSNINVYNNVVDSNSNVSLPRDFVRWFFAHSDCNHNISEINVYNNYYHKIYYPDYNYDYNGCSPEQAAVAASIVINNNISFTTYNSTIQTIKNNSGREINNNCN